MLIGRDFFIALKTHRIPISGRILAVLATLVMLAMRVAETDFAALCEREPMKR
jgi:hypothetical protein